MTDDTPQEVPDLSSQAGASDDLPEYGLHNRPDTAEERRKQVESILFAAGKAMTFDRIMQLTGFTKKKTENALEDLRKLYADQDSSLEVEHEGEFWKFTVRKEYLPLVRNIVSETELPKSVLETLAVIAWRSPCLQAEIAKIRTNKAYDHITLLYDLGFVTKSPQGRSYELRVTEKFFEYFDIEGAEGIRDVFKKVEESNRAMEEEQRKVEIESLGQLAADGWVTEEEMAFVKENRLSVEEATKRAQKRAKDAEKEGNKPTFGPGVKVEGKDETKESDEKDDGLHLGKLEVYDKPEAGNQSSVQVVDEQGEEPSDDSSEQSDAEEEPSEGTEQESQESSEDESESPEEEKSEKNQEEADSTEGDDDTEEETKEIS